MYFLLTIMASGSSLFRLHFLILIISFKLKTTGNELFWIRRPIIQIKLLSSYLSQTFILGLLHHETFTLLVIKTVTNCFPPFFIAMTAYVGRATLF